MISKIEIKNWRSYEDIVIKLDAKVVFFVTPNAVGKTSLIEALRWCLLGKPDPGKMKSAIRQGTKSAFVAIDVALGVEGPYLHVERSLPFRGKPEFRAIMRTGKNSSEEIDEDKYKEMLSEHWCADDLLIDRLIFGDPHPLSAKTDFPVRDHWASILGLAPLLEACKNFTQEEKKANDKIKTLRDEITAFEAELEGLSDSGTKTSMTLDSLLDQQQQLSKEIQNISNDVNLAERWRIFKREAQEYSRNMQRIFEEVSTIVDTSIDTLEMDLTSAYDSAEAVVTQARQTKAEHDISRARSNNASELLSNEISECPTCLRPLTNPERVNALERHDNFTTKSDHLAVDASRMEADAIEYQNSISNFLTRLRNLKNPSPPLETEPDSDSEAKLAKLVDQERDVIEKIGYHRAMLELRNRNKQLQEILVERRSLLNSEAYKSQALVTSKNLFEKLSDRILEERLNPLLSELSKRWKLIFGTEGLTLDPKGRLNLNGLLAEDLSGGERTVAFLLTRLLAAGATTDIPTACFDEPLEHLDHRRRASVARTLVRAAQTGTVTQVVVTTYEERIARQLAAIEPETIRVVYGLNQR